MNFTPINYDAVCDMLHAYPTRQEMHLKVFRLFIHFLHIAQRQDASRGGIALKRGDVTFTLRDLSSETDLSVQTIRTILGHFLSTKNLTQKLTQPKMVLSVVDFDTYVIDGMESNTESNTKITQSQHTYSNVNAKRESTDLVETSVSTAQGALELNEKPAAKRDDYMDAMAKYWKLIQPTKKIPYSSFGKWRKEYGADLALDLLQELYNKEFQPREGATLEGYVVVTLKKRKKEAQQIPGEFTESDYAGLDEWVDKGAHENEM